MSLRGKLLASLTIHRGLVRAGGILVMGLSLALVTGSPVVETLTLAGVMVLILAMRALGVTRILRPAGIALVGILRDLLLAGRVACWWRGKLRANPWQFSHNMTVLVGLLELIVLGSIWNMRSGGRHLALTLASMN